MFTVKIMRVWKLPLLNQYVVISCSHKTGVGRHFKFSNIPQKIGHEHDDRADKKK